LIEGAEFSLTRIFFRRREDALVPRIRKESDEWKLHRQLGSIILPIR